LTALIGAQLANDRANADNARPLMPLATTRAPWIAAALAIATMLVAAGCGSEPEPDAARGKELFTQRCGACHILENAGTKGVQGPNLDLAFAAAVKDGLGRSTIEGVVRKQIQLPMGKQMPANLVTGADADAVAAYVADAIGKQGSGDSGSGPSGTAKADGQNTLQIPADANGQLAYQFKSAEAQAGEVTIESQNDSSVPHNIALKNGPEGEVVQGGKTSTIRADLKPGKQTFFCSVPGHEQAGMTGTLTIK
jgi:mono/diheme cytochrome c family protein